MPLDPQGKGSWIGVTRDSIACILNHRGKEDSNSSRGQLLFKLLTNQITVDHLENRSKDYNSFHLIYLNKKNKNYCEYIWDGKYFKYKSINSNLNIWSSNTVYNQLEIKNKLDFFNLKCTKKTDCVGFMNFHLNSKNIKNEKVIKTTSITQVLHDDSIEMHYNDLVKNKNYHLKLSS